MIQLRRAALLLSTAFLAACLGTAAEPTDGPAPDDDSGDPSTPGQPTPDDGGQNPALCALEAGYADFGVLTGANALFAPVDPAAPDGPRVIRLAVVIGEGPIVDALFIDLWEGFGAFTNGFVPGTFELVGVEADLATCGACVYMGGDVDTVNGAVTQQFHANGGTLTIDSINPVAGGQIVGSLSNVTLREVLVDPMTDALTDVPNGCTTNLQGMGFEAGLQAP